LLLAAERLAPVPVWHVYFASRNFAIDVPIWLKAVTIGHTL
jgi:hypothetical protein